MADLPLTFETKTVENVLNELKVQVASGLSSAEVKERQLTLGLNEVPDKKQSILLLFLRHFWGLTAIMLELTIVVSFILHKYVDVYLISALMLFNAIIGFIQEIKADRSVKALKKNLQVMVRVLRNGQWMEVAGNQLVPGDILRIRTGDFIAADAKLITGNAASDQSALTGESRLINKGTGDLLYAGSLIKNGECNAVVVATGLTTTFGKTALLVQKAHPRLHMEEVVGNMVKILFSMVLVFLTLTIIISLFRGQPLLPILPLLLFLLISAVPVALPAMFTVSMSKGSQNLAAQGILVSRLSATEDAATLTTLCLDKTGTLTQNKLSVQEIMAAGKYEEREVLQYAVMASFAANNDPIDMAFLQKATEDKIDLTGFSQISFTPFSAANKRTEALIQKGKQQFRVIKGAYNTIKELCHFRQPDIDQKVEIWASKGFKTMAVAISQNEVASLVGLAALIDPPLPDSGKMITQLKGLGVKVKMLTGDALPIAKEIALQVGVGEDIVAASLLRNDPPSTDIHPIIISHNGFAEVLPEDKFNIVKSLQQYQEITGMTGDGVNDAPALKQAEVGIAVKNATDVAKQAASVILLNNGLEGIINLITTGRVIHHRITNWVVSKISKTLATVAFVCMAYILTGEFVVDAFDMVLLLFIIDFASLSLSTDTVSWSRNPESWALKPLMIKGCMLGILTFLEALFWLYAGKNYFGITGLKQLHSWGFSILFFSSVFNILVIRTPGRFYQQPIGKGLLCTLIADVILVLLMLSIGIPGFSILPISLTLSSLFYFLVCSLLVNDWLKLKVT
ncbi:MAG: plasma-membrane proton-efflux P-type ATPase [Chitinophagaceae bacterium]